MQEIVLFSNISCTVEFSSVARFPDDETSWIQFQLPILLLLKINCTGNLMKTGTFIGTSYVSGSVVLMCSVYRYLILETGEGSAIVNPRKLSEVTRSLHGELHSAFSLHGSAFSAVGRKRGHMFLERTRGRSRKSHVRCIERYMKFIFKGLLPT